MLDQASSYVPLRGTISKNNFDSKIRLKVVILGREGLNGYLTNFELRLSSLTYLNF